jgi:hypothetical protein
MAPIVTKIIAHETPNRRRIWAPHGQYGCFIGPALDHYRCYTVYIAKTRSERVVETVECFPHRSTTVIYIIKGSGNSGSNKIDSCTTQPANGHTILSGRRQTNDRSHATSSNLRGCAVDAQIGCNLPL